MRINGLILAAGLSSRMGHFKPLMPLGEKSIIENSIDSMVTSGVCEVKVVVGYQADRIICLLNEKYDQYQVTTAYNKNYSSSDMLDSIKAGLREFPSCDAFFLLPGDMPVITSKTYLKLICTMEHTKSKVVFPTVNGRRKHPPLISADCIGDILSFEENGGLRELWKQYSDSITEVSVNDSGCDIDADTMEDYCMLTQYFRDMNPGR